MNWFTSVLLIGAYIGSRAFVAAAFGVRPFPSAALRKPGVISLAAAPTKEPFPIYSKFEKSRQIFREAQVCIFHYIIRSFSHLTKYLCRNSFRAA
jgi:hypothetical protein